VGGMLADGKSPRQVLIYTDTARGLAQLAAVALLMTGAPWGLLVLAYLIFGIGIGVSRPCAQVLLVNLLSPKALVAGNGAMNFIDNLVAILFPATLGVFIILWDPVWGILIDGLTFFGAAIYTAQLPNIGQYESEEEFSLREVLNGVTVVINNATLRMGFAATLVVNVMCFPIFLVAAPYAITLRFSEDMWGYCLAASGFGACIGSIITVLASGHERLVGLAAICGLFLAGAMALLGLGTSAWMVILGATFVGIVEASWLTGWATSMQILSPERDLGKVVAVDTFVTSGLHPFIYLGSGVVGGVIGYSKALTLTAVVSLVGMLLIILTSIIFIPRGVRNDQVQ
ncbi:MFS transporter, partial [Pseudomonas aeruginosa]|uniref:MFS transporter n=1 Tax=Pseudomonas aeruginosa TaxID=287 RepID=UPI00396AB073